MSVRHSNENLVSLGVDNSVTCILCNEVVFDLDLTETACKHYFHKACLQNCLQPCSESQNGTITNPAVRTQKCST